MTLCHVLLVATLGLVNKMVTVKSFYHPNFIPGEVDKYNTALQYLFSESEKFGVGILTDSITVSNTAHGYGVDGSCLWGMLFRDRNGEYPYLEFN